MLKGTCYFTMLKSRFFVRDIALPIFGNNTQPTLCPRSMQPWRIAWALKTSLLRSTWLHSFPYSFFLCCRQLCLPYFLPVVSMSRCLRPGLMRDRILHFHSRHPEWLWMDYGCRVGRVKCPTRTIVIAFGTSFFSCLLYYFQYSFFSSNHFPLFLRLV